jgi:hypothetical protein
VAELRAMLERLPDDMPVLMYDNRYGGEIWPVDPPEVIEAFMSLPGDNPWGESWQKIRPDKSVPDGVEQVRVLLIN